MGMGRGAEEIRVEAGRLHLYPAIHHASALRERGGAAHHDEQPHGQGDGIRLVRSGGARSGLRTRPEIMHAPAVGWVSERSRLARLRWRNPPPMARRIVVGYAAQLGCKQPSCAANPPYDTHAFACVVVALFLLLSNLPARAEGPAEFYKGKNVELYIGYSVGGAYDLYTRVLARHLGKHIPGNPTIVPKNLEGAGSLRLANWLYN